MISEPIPNPGVTKLTLDAGQVADMLGVSPRKVANLIKDSRDPLPSVKLGGRRLFDPEAVTLWWKRKVKGTDC